LIWVWRSRRTTSLSGILPGRFPDGCTRVQGRTGNVGGVVNVMIAEDAKALWMKG